MHSKKRPRDHLGRCYGLPLYGSPVRLNLLHRVQFLKLGLLFEVGGIHLIDLWSGFKVEGHTAVLRLESHGVEEHLLVLIRRNIHLAGQIFCLNDIHRLDSI
jgi:hypothetical protein